MEQLKLFRKIHNITAKSFMENSLEFITIFRYFWKLVFVSRNLVFHWLFCSECAFEIVFMQSWWSLVDIGYG